jgi:hypothetical protein
MNQKGEITLFSCLILFLLAGIVLLSALELRKSFHHLEKRTQLFLCVKKTKGELHQFLKMMGRTNWGIKNLNKASLIMLFIPGLQGASMSAKKIKTALQHIQEIRLLSYLKTLKDIQGQNCPLDPRMFITPYQLGAQLLKRDQDGAAILRSKEWTYGYLSKPYLITIKINASKLEKTNPKIHYLTEEKAEKLSSLLSSL